MSPVERQSDSDISALYNLKSKTGEHFTFKCSVLSIALESIINRLGKESEGRLITVIGDCSRQDPEFLFKIAFYCHKHLNIQKITNLLFSSACLYAECRVFLTKYFDACISSPMDWIKVVEYYALLSNDFSLNKMPNALKRCMISKFTKFSPYDLAQCRRKIRAECASECEMGSKTAGDKAVDYRYGNFLSVQGDKSANIFTLKDIVRKLHIRKPAFSVMCILEKKYPSNFDDFIHTNLDGDWDASKAGLRMKLPNHPKSALKNVSTWRNLIACGELGHEIILQNIESILDSHLSEAEHEIILQILSKQVSFFLSKDCLWVVIFSFHYYLVCLFGFC
uniref:TROVE domain-containing protein n=2 Tax=Trichobilharzia regenti TaxID=157069 RepID=A0AA85JC09_TRIRE|nr:unnamed protein product [Trichobilharzia regenti]